MVQFEANPQHAVVPVAGNNAQRRDFAGVGHMRPDAGTGVVIPDVDDPHVGSSFRQPGETVLSGCLFEAHVFVPYFHFRSDLFVDRLSSVSNSSAVRLRSQ